MKIKLISTGCEGTSGQQQPNDQCKTAKNSIVVNEKELSLNQFGFNIAVINSINGHVLHRKRFDTEKSASECLKMANLINSVPTTSIVVGVVKGRADKYFRSNRDLKIAMVSF